MTIVTHPDNIPLLRKRFEQARFISMAGVEMSLYGSKHIAPTSWTPPKGDRFVEYGPEDEHWMRPLGLGSMEPVFYVING
jgi:hypothetical protein